MNRQVAARCLIALPAMAVLLGLAASALWRAQADFSGREARYRLDKAILGRQAMGPQEWERTRVLLEGSLAMEPNDATYNEDLANLHFLRAAQARGDSRLLRTHYELALAQYQKAAALRPTSAYTHASIATVKLRLGQFDPDFSRALLLATRYGPWEPAVHSQVMAAGLLAWVGLAEPVRTAVRGNLERAHALDATRTEQYLRANRRTMPPCDQLRVAIPGICPAP